MNPEAEKLVMLLTSYAHQTLMVMMRLNALERTLHDKAPVLWNEYLRQYDSERNLPDRAAQQRALRADAELDQAIAEFRNLLQKAEEEEK